MLFQRALLFHPRYLANQLRAMARSNMTSLPFYPEGRACTRPTTSRLIELFEPLQRHVIQGDADNESDEEPLVLT